jgi:hypothetical protein
MNKSYEPLTYKNSVELLHRAVRERGEGFVYPQEWTRRVNEKGSFTCQYVHPDGTCPGCIIGYVLYLHGVPLDILKLHEGENAVDLLENLNIIREEDLVDYLLTRVQVNQDGGLSWKKAVDSAIRDYRTFKEEGE